MGVYGNPAQDQHNETVKKQYEYDLANYNFNWATQADIDASLADDDDDNDITQVGQIWQQYDQAVADRDTMISNDAQNIAYQNQAAWQSYDYNVNLQEYQYQQAQTAYTKSLQIFGNQLDYNDQALNSALAQEDSALNDIYMNAAFENTALIANLFEATGNAGWDKAANALNLQNTKGELNHQKDLAFLNMNNAIEQANFDKGMIQTNFLDAKGQAAFQKGMIQSNLVNAQGQAQFDKNMLEQQATHFEQNQAIKKEGLDLQIRTSYDQMQHDNDMIRKQNEQDRAKSAFSMQEANIQSLKQQGAAQATQAGRSQGKTIQMFLAELGRNNAYVVDSIVRGTNAANAQLKRNHVMQLDRVQQAAIAEAKIDADTENNLMQTMMKMQEVDRNLDMTTLQSALKTGEVDRNLSIASMKSNLSISQIQNDIGNIIESTSLDVGEIDRNLAYQEVLTGFKDDKIDWDLANVGSTFRINQSILAAQLESATQATADAKYDLQLDAYQANLNAYAGLMQEPGEPPNLPQPIDLPIPEYADITIPLKPPAPIKGAMMSSNNTMNAAQSILGGVSAGVGVASAMTNAGLAGAGPVGWAVGIGSALFL